MDYFKAVWKHSHDKEPVLIYCELDGLRWEQRKVEVYRDGRMGFASKDEEYLGTSLAVLQDPPVEEIDALPDFEARIIGSDEFETVWNEALMQARKQP
jgi:hypothetical protein